MPVILPSQPPFLDAESTGDVKQRQTIATREGLSKQLELEEGLSKETASKIAGIKSSAQSDQATAASTATAAAVPPPSSIEPDPADDKGQTSVLPPDWVKTFLVVDALVDDKKQAKADAFLARLHRDSTISLKKGNIFEGAKNRGSLCAAVALLYQPSHQKAPQLQFFRRYTRPKEALSRHRSAGEKEEQAAKRRIAPGFKRLRL